MIRDIIEHVIKQKWAVRSQNEKWTKRLLEWRPRMEDKRSERQLIRSTDDLKKIATNWIGRIEKDEQTLEEAVRRTYQ